MENAKSAAMPPMYFAIFDMGLELKKITLNPQDIENEQDVIQRHACQCRQASIISLAVGSAPLGRG